MITSASMTKHIPVTGVLTDKTPDLFTRAYSGSKYRGFASFGEDDSASVILEVADTPELRERGLMGRENLPACCGMIFTDLTGGFFWMKGCKIPLDIVFIDDNGEVSLKYSMKADNGLKRYRYGDESTAIELPYGFCDTHGIDIGTPCKWRTW